MIPRLALRRLLMLLNLVLLAGMVGGGYYAAAKVMTVLSKDTGAAGNSGAQGEPRQLYMVKARNDYNVIVDSGIFGPAGIVAKKEEEVKVEPPVDPNPPETELPLSLCGTSVTGGKDGKDKSSAIIINKTNNVSDCYGMGSVVVDGVTVEAIRQREVVLFNKNSNKNELLKMLDSKDKELAAAGGGKVPGPGGHAEPPKPGDATPTRPGAPSNPAVATAQAPPSPNRVNLKRDELTQQFLVNYGDLVGKIKPQTYTDPNTGQPAGITATGLNDVPLAKTLDLHDGDVLQSINNEPIDGEGKIVELIGKYQNATSFRLGILRDGKPRVITYNLQ